MKIGPIVKAIDGWNRTEGRNGRIRLEQLLVHTGQHYDDAMSKVFFDELEIARPDVDLGVGSGSQAQQTASLMTAIEPVMVSERPDLVVVVGDVNTTLAAALVASKLNVPIAHVESGLRSGDRAMPEEINRVVADHVSTLLFATSRSAIRQLAREGVDPAWLHFVGNSMIDCLQSMLPRARSREKAKCLGLESRRFGVVTLHRPSNVDDPVQLGNVMTALREVASRVPIVFPVHARTAGRLQSLSMPRSQAEDEAVSLLPPLGYLDFLSLMADARFVLTDSGGVQAETCVVGTPCITARTTTEWTETLEAGVNTLVDPYDPKAIVSAVDTVLAAPMPSPVRPELWDGHAAERIVAVIADWALANL